MDTANPPVNPSSTDGGAVLLGPGPRPGSFECTQGRAPSPWRLPPSELGSILDIDLLRAQQALLSRQLFAESRTVFSRILPGGGRVHGLSPGHLREPALLVHILELEPPFEGKASPPNGLGSLVFVGFSSNRLAIPTTA